MRGGGGGGLRQPGRDPLAEPAANQGRRQQQLLSTHHGSRQQQQQLHQGNDDPSAVKSFEQSGPRSSSSTRVDNTCAVTIKSEFYAGQLLLPDRYNFIIDEEFI